MTIINYYQQFLTIISLSWQDNLVYRMNFIMWRIRSFIRIIMIFSLWNAVMSSKPTIFGYTQGEMNTYILGISILTTFVYSSKSTGIQEDIASGTLSNYLVKPLHYFYYYIVRDIADKIQNLLFFAFEFFLLLLMFHPTIVAIDIDRVIPFVLSVFGGIILYFLFRLIVSMTTFWYPEHNGWSQTFLVLVFLETLSGGLFPIDILPNSIRQVFLYLPTSFFQFVPMQMYLGRIQPSSYLTVIGIFFLWLCVFSIFSYMIWCMGLRRYEAYGK